MEFLSLLSALVIFSPFTVSSGHLLCNQMKCPKINCFVGWQYKGYDMNGRYYTTCRFYTRNGMNLKKTVKRFNRNVKETYHDIF
jgi:hypothetical protein